MAAALSHVLARLADFVWPRPCAVATCGRMSDRPGRHVCSACFAGLPFFESGGMCRVCGGLVAAPTEHDFVCDDCRTAPPAYEYARSAVRFIDPVRSLILDFKYRHATWLREDLVDLLEGAVRAKLDFTAIDVVVPVPLHPNRQRERGYNQSALLGASLARRLNRRFDNTSFVRIRDTEHQARLDRANRLTNLDGAFAVADARGVRGRTILLVDDVSTTGATLSHCARPLIAAGAARVWCATVARSTSEG